MGLELVGDDKLSSVGGNYHVDGGFSYAEGRLHPGESGLELIIASKGIGISIEAECANGTMGVLATLDPEDAGTLAAALQEMVDHLEDLDHG